MKLKISLRIFGVVLAGFVFFSLIVQPMIDTTHVQVSMEQIKYVLQDVTNFRKKHGRLPGDINEDGMIGRRDFGETLLQHVGETKDDEARLFWKELASHFPANGGSQLNLRGTYLIVGYLDGKPLSQGGAIIKGNVIIWAGGKSGQLYPLTPGQAAYAERKQEFKEVDPKNGRVQAYGSADCFAEDGSYNLDDTNKSCGLIFSLLD